MPGSSHPPLAYRPEIDGLRALAVLPVIFFHAGWSAFPGGYVGVDVFFVISGYLITSLIAQALKRGNFSFSSFYYNRAKRLLPALLFVLLLTLPVAVHLMLPDELAAFGKSNVYALTFLANFYFKKSADYFSPSSDQLPLLHTWSLAVEEQFYLVFPVFLWLLWSRGRGFVFKALATALVISFLLALLGSRNFPVSNYYMLPTRAWELLAGALLVFWVQPGFLQRHAGHWVVKGGLPLLGLGLIAYPVATFDRSTPYPGPMTLLPVLGAVLVILFAAERGLVHRCLSLRPLVFLGGMSYSLYLWHFPIFALNNIYRAQYGASIAMGWLLALLLAMAFVSLRLVERPMRRLHTARPQVGAALGTACLLLIAAGWLLQTWPGLFKPYSPAQLQFMAVKGHDAGAYTWERCSAAGITQACEGGDLGARKKVILFGDSHSYTLFHAMSDALSGKGKKLVLVTDGNCPPVLAFDPALAGDKCIGRSKAIYQAILHDSDVEAVVLVARWSWYLHGEPFDNLQGGVGEKSSNFLAGHHRGGEGRIKLMSSLFEGTFRALSASGIPTVVVNTIPEPGWNVQKKALYMLGDTPLEQLSLAYDAKVFSKRNADFDTTLEKFQGVANFMVVQPSSLFCNASVPLQCSSMRDGTPLYMDDNHLSYLGSQMVSGQILQALASFL